MNTLRELAADACCKYIVSAKECERIYKYFGNHHIQTDMIMYDIRTLKRVYKWARVEYGGNTVGAVYIGCSFYTADQLRDYHILEKFVGHTNFKRLLLWISYFERLDLIHYINRICYISSGDIRAMLRVSKNINNNICIANRCDGSCLDASSG
jgi:hypothetical protein